MPHSEDEKDSTGSSRPDSGAEPTAPASSQGGWVDKLAERSSGLPGKTTKSSSGEPEVAGGAGGAGGNSWHYAGLGLQFAGTVGIFAAAGYWLDHRFGWSPWGIVTLTMIAVIGSMYLLIKEGMKDNR